MTTTIHGITEQAERTLIERHDARPWVSRDGSRARLYVNDWSELIGLQVERYGTGNISSAHLDGEKISSRQAGLILGAVDGVWVEDGAVHIRTGRGADSHRWVVDALRTAIERVIEEA